MSLGMGRGSSGARTTRRAALVSPMGTPAHTNTQKRTAKKRNGFVTAHQARAIQPSVHHTGKRTSRGARRGNKNKEYIKLEKNPGGAPSRRRPCGPSDRRAVEKAPLAARLTGRPLALLCSILILRRGVVLANIYIERGIYIYMS